MLKLITGVILLIIILFTSHYILVEKDVENFYQGPTEPSGETNAFSCIEYPNKNIWGRDVGGGSQGSGLSNEQCKQICEGNTDCNVWVNGNHGCYIKNIDEGNIDSLMRNVNSSWNYTLGKCQRDICMYCNYNAVHQKSSDYNSPEFIDDNCCKCFLNNPEEMYNNYKTIIEEDPDLSTPNSYKDVNQTMLSQCKPTIIMNTSKNGSGTELASSSDGSHCNIYTNDDNLYEDMEDYYMLDRYIFDNKNNLSLCYLDDKCTFDTHQQCVQKCDNKTINYNEECDTEECKYDYVSYQNKCYNYENQTDCEQNPRCEFFYPPWRSEGECRPINCGSLNEDDCNTKDFCEYSNGFCRTKYQDELTEDQNIQYTVKRCEVDRWVCPRESIDSCESNTKCALKDFPKCVKK